MKVFAFGRRVLGLDYGDRPVVGAKVHQPYDFKRLVLGYLAERQPKLIVDEDDPGFWTINVTEIVPMNILSFGIGKRTRFESDYVLRMHHGHVQAFLKRKFALAVEACKVQIDTLELYRDEWLQQEEAPFPDDEFAGVTHVVSGVMICAGPMQAGVPTPTDLVHQIALKLDKRETLDVTQTINRAWESDRFWDDFCRVSD